MKRKLVLVNPVPPAAKGLTEHRTSRLQPIGLGIVAALTPDHWEVELVDENWESFTYRPADLVGITAFTPAANRAYQIAAVYKAHRVPVVIGGIHASMCTEEALKYVNAVVLGEAEAIWRKVITDAEAGQLQNIYQGKYADLTGAPKPRRDLFRSEYLFASVQTSRGCPMDCEFCSVSSFNGRRYRRRPVNEVLDELETIPQKLIYFVDDNIIGYSQKSKKLALALFKGMVERKLDKWWHCMASLNIADDEEVLHWAHKSGCKMIFLGVEATDTDALEEVNKRVNLEMGIDAYEEAFRRIQKAHISAWGAFIFGMDTDTKSVLKRRADYIVGSRVDIRHMTYLTPFPGTRLFTRFKQADRLLYTDFPADWDRYTMGEVVYKPNKMTPAELMQAMAESNRRLYTRPTLFRKAWRTLRETKDPIATMFAFGTNQVYGKLWQDGTR